MGMGKGKLELHLRWRRLLPAARERGGAGGVVGWSSGLRMGGGVMRERKERRKRAMGKKGRGGKGKRKREGDQVGG